MKIDWSKILIAAMVLFIIFIVSMGIKMATSNQALYEDDYYEQGEMHAERMEQERVGQKVSVEYNRSKNTLDLVYEGTGYATGYKLVFLADNVQDFGIKDLSKTEVKEQSLAIPQDLKEGIWYLEIEGQAGGQAFFKKQQFVK